MKTGGNGGEERSDGCRRAEVEASSQPPTSRLLGVAAVWLMLATGGLGFLMHYANRPGLRGAVPSVWPEELGLERSADLPTLLVFVHPRCPCTRATMDELAWVLARCEGRVDCRVYFLRPAGVPAQWTRTDCWRTAASIPGVQPLEDAEGRLSRAFGARTSGHVYLYDAAGRLRFDGGITPSRGHRGDNQGRQRLVELLVGRSVAEVAGGSRGAREGEWAGLPIRSDSSCVFGCPLEPAGDAEREGAGRVESAGPKERSGGKPGGAEEDRGAGDV